MKKEKITIELTKEELNTLIDGLNDSYVKWYNLYESETDTDVALTYKYIAHKSSSLSGKLYNALRA